MIGHKENCCSLAGGGPLDDCQLRGDPARKEAVRLKYVAKVLGGVDKLEPVSGGGDMDHAEEAFGELVVSSGDGAVDFQATEEAFDVVSLTVERPVMFDLDPAI